MKAGTLMELQQLRYFHEVARSEHITNSAKKLHVAQPALTQTIHRLEQELGVKLLERAGRGVRLTACGRALDERIRPVLAALDSIPDELAEVAGRENATVRLSILSASGLVVDAIAAWRSQHPDTRFVITQQEAQEHWDIRLSTEGVNRPHGSTSLHVEPPHLYRERIGIAVPIERAGQGPIDLADLAEDPFICLAGSRAFREACDRLCAEVGFRPSVAFESDGPEVVRNMIGLGLGVGFWPERSWGALGDGSARLEPLSDARFVRTIKLETAHPLREEAAAFHGFLATYFDERWREASPLDG